MVVIVNNVYFLSVIDLNVIIYDFFIIVLIMKNYNK